MLNNVLSVYLFAYNHESYIEQCIDSVLSQKTTFPYAIYVYDDFSNDNTADIARKYTSLFPDKVYLVENTENHGINYQFEKAMLSTQTKYVCISGGDDYWIDEFKLQKQVDFLDTHLDYSLLHTNCVTLYESTGEQKYKNKVWTWDMPSDRIDRICSLFLNKMKGGYPLMTSSCFRSDEIKYCLNEHPEIIHSPVVGEGTTILTSIALYGGNIGYLPEATVVYRVRTGSLSHKKTKFEQIRYHLSYTGLRIQILKSLDVEKSKIVQISKELFKSDILNSISLNAYDMMLDFVKQSLSDVELYELFKSVHKKYYILSRLPFLFSIYVKILILRQRFFD